MIEAQRGDPKEWCAGHGTCAVKRPVADCYPCDRTQEANMRCEQCGRPMENAEMWQLGGNPSAPSSRSMRQICWDCRQKAEAAAEGSPKSNVGVLAEASEVVKQFETNQL